MMTGWAAARREVLLFLLLAALPALVIAGLFRLHPWPTPMRQQADLLGWLMTTIHLALGALDVALLPSTGTAMTLRLSDGRRWIWLGVVSMAIGAIYGLSDLGINRLTSWGAPIAAVDRHNGFSNVFLNVRPLWSLAH